jgi:peroxiredoxin
LLVFLIAEPNNMKPLFFFFFVIAATFAQAQEKPEGLFINSKAPEFKGTDQSGVALSLKDLRKKGPVVLLFYRGNWCPYCNKELKRFQDSLNLITEKGAQLIAITPEGSEGLAKTVEKTGAVFPILTDTDMKISKSYAVAYDVDDRTLGRYKNAGIDLLTLNGQKQAQLPVPAVYIINKEGAVSYRYFDADYRKRVSVKEILSELK